MPKHVGVENLERIIKKSTTTLSIRWSFYKRNNEMCCLCRKLQGLSPGI
jgi:hypothetical protein